MMTPTFLPSARISFLTLTLIVSLTLMSTSVCAAPRYKLLHNFSGPDGGSLFSSLLLDGKRNIYGLAAGGGPYNGGTVFELTPSSDGEWAETTLYNFCSQPHCTDGWRPLGGLIFDAGGNLYGPTGFGGSSNLGVVFELTPGSAGWSYKALYESGSSIGWIFDDAGNLYGFGGPGTYHAGAVAELSPAYPDWAYTLLHSFDLRKGHHDGFFPASALIFDAKGNLYDTTEHGGINGDGIVFELTPPPPDPAPKEWSEHILHSFPAFSGDGQQPYSGLVFDSSGNLYGATAGGGTPNSLCPSGCGTIFKLTPGLLGEWKETILHKFVDPWNGAAPVGTLVFDRAGNLYGATAGGGKSQNCNGGCGTVFKMTPDGNGKWNYTVLHRFTGNDGANPQAGLTLDKKGNLYGTTIQGGKGFYGVVYEITP
jgi:uncharacterized repeat protein (TIGR03803 family)